MSSAPSTSTGPPVQSISPWVWLAILVGAGAMLLAVTLNPSPISEGSVRLSYRQRGRASEEGNTLRFDLPAGWWVKYNGHQPWRGGTVVDAEGRPCIEVWLHEGECPWDAPAEVCQFPWGQAACRTRTQRMAQPFNSFPAVSVGDGWVVERAFLFGRGYVLFRVPRGRDAGLEPVIGKCMQSLCREDR